MELRGQTPHPRVFLCRLRLPGAAAWLAVSFCSAPLLLLLGARAALFRSILDGVLHVRHDLDERRLHLGRVASLSEARDVRLHIPSSALAAFLLVLDVTSGL